MILTKSSPNKQNNQIRIYERGASIVFLKTNETFGGLSNMAGGFPLSVNGIRILTSEALYQACRFPHRPDVQKLIIGQNSPMTAKMKSKPYRHDSRPDWDLVRVKIMRWCLRVKLAQNWDSFSRLLLQTGDLPIVEQSRKDDFWGAKPTDENTLIGINVLGRLLMELREEVKSKNKESLVLVEPPEIQNFFLDGNPIGAVSEEDIKKPKHIYGASEREKPAVIKPDRPLQTSLFEPRTVNEAASDYLEAAHVPLTRSVVSNRYPNMKDSGVPWLGEIPDHWKILPNRAIFVEVNERNHPDEQMLSVTINKGVIRQKALLTDTSKKDSSNLDRSAYKLVRPGDIVYNKMRAWQGALGLSDYQGIVSPAYVVQRPRNSVNPQYFHYLMRTPAFAKEAERWSYGITSDMWSLRPEHFKMIYICLPPHGEQTAVVRFLNHYDRKIRRYIRAKQKLIKLLEEQKQTIIHRTVTRGLNPDVPLKSSGIPWLGDIPAHWEVRRVKQVTKILRGKFSYRPRNDPSLYDGPYPFIQTGAVAQAKKIITVYTQTLNERGLSVSKMFPKGTLCMTIAANIGDVSILDFEACFPDSIVGFVPNSILERDFLYFVFRCLKPELLRDAPVNTQGNLNVERIGMKFIPFPDLVEQKLIVKNIEERIKIFDKAIDRIEREIALAQEYRTRLTADIVTGKLDVREAATRLPEELIETMSEDKSDISEEDTFDEEGFDLDNVSEEAEA
ncbi:MAG: DUF1768 domain-containing protein [Syntrophaceae bacterium]|nr:DUF1768 domain-containing protein [Syntrophaceae bacterium]